MIKINGIELLVGNEDNQFKEALIKRLQHEVACTTALYESLESEREALSSMDEKLITISSDNKQKLVSALQEASDARTALMSENGLQTSEESIERYIDSRESNSVISALFLHLSELAYECFEENRLIGQLINRRTQFVTQTLNSLSPSADVSSPTYEQNGSKESLSTLYTNYSI